MEIHIGSLIKNRAKELRIGPTELGAKISTSKQNVYGIYKRASIDTKLLRKLSDALDFDFFQHYSQSLDVSVTPGNPNGCAECKAELLAITSRLDAETEMNDYLKKIKSLLEEKVSELQRMNGQHTS